MRYNELVAEVFQPGKNWQWEFRGSEEAFATFTIGEIEYLWTASVMNKRDPTQWTLTFRQRGQEDMDKMFGLTGTGNSQEVISTVVDITREFLKQYGDKVLEIKFSSDGDSRTSLYARMVKRLLPNWDMSKRNAGGEFDFLLINPRAYELDEAPLADYQPIGDFSKPGPFRATDKKLVTHPVNQLKAQKFFEQTPYDFRLFFSNIPGTGKYSESGPMRPEQIQNIFGAEAEQIIAGSQEAITVVFVGNAAGQKVMITPWIMAHRIGHAIQAGERQTAGTWRAAEQHFFSNVNRMLEDYYGKRGQGFAQSMRNDLSKEYAALFNAIGTQRSSRTGQITRPYEFLYELFAQYLGTGKITLNPLPKQQGYGRKAWGNTTQSLNMRNADEEAGYSTEVLARDMELMFDDVLSSLVGKILVM